jgi:hypothetical protein
METNTPQSAAQTSALVGSMPVAASISKTIQPPGIAHPLVDTNSESDASNFENTVEPKQFAVDPISQKPKFHQPKHFREYQSTNDRSDIAHRRISTLVSLRSVIRRLLSSREWVAELLREFCSFLYRSTILLRTRSVAVADLGPHAGRDASGRLVPCSRTRGRIQDVQKFRGCRSWVTLEHLEIYLIGWNAGAAWADRNPHACTLDRDIPGKTLQPPCMSAPVSARRWKDLPS